jgi:hypothetical protein
VGSLSLVCSLAAERRVVHRYARGSDLR